MPSLPTLGPFVPAPLVQAPVALGRRAARAALLRRAREVTGEIADLSLLVIAPHPDDETLGCGATIARARASGRDVTVLVVSDGSRSHTAPDLTPADLAAIRRQEVITAVSRLGDGISLRFLDLPDGELTDRAHVMVPLLRSTIEDLGPALVLSPSIDEPPPDHAAVGLAVRDAVASAGTTARLWEYPVWLWSRWPLPRGGAIPAQLGGAVSAVASAPVVRVTAGAHLAAKRHALAAHETQTTHYRHDVPWVPLPEAMLELSLQPQELFFPVTVPR